MSLTLARIKMAEAEQALRAAESALKGVATLLEGTDDANMAPLVLAVGNAIGHVAECTRRTGIAL